MSPEELSKRIYSIVCKLVENGEAGHLALTDVPSVEKFAVMRPKDRNHGDWASNVAMQLAKKSGKNPREFAQVIVEELKKDNSIDSVEIAGPGFINIRLNSSSAAQVIEVIERDKQQYGKNSHLSGSTINLEFVSANPTGPIHIGGVRWAAVGDSMARVLRANGAKVICEYYFNDHGEQINRFAKSLVAAAHHEEVPADGYKGTYINEIVERVIESAQKDNVDILHLPRVDDGANADGLPLGEGDSQQREAFRAYAVPMMFAQIKQSIVDFRVHFDVWFHENSLYEEGKVEKALDILREHGDLQKRDGALWFLSTKYGDDKDRVIVKSNGDYSYFAADLAYYLDKRHRDHDPAQVAIYMLGADHHGYIGRMMAMCSAFGDTPGVNMQILIGQLVNVLKDGHAVRMSKRAGNVVTIDDLVEAVGVDAARYSLARTDYHTPVDIDLALLASHTNENPVYYVQYAHARACNVERNANDAHINKEVSDLSCLTTEQDSTLLGLLAQWPSVLQQAGDLRAPHRVARYLEDLAGAYHKWYNSERVVPMELTGAEYNLAQADREDLALRKNPDEPTSAARLRLNNAVRTVIVSGLDLLGVQAPEHM